MDKLLKDILREEMQARGFTPARIRRESGIAERYVLAFLNGDSTKLPAAPYVRGYLITIAKLLELNGEELWELHEKEVVHITRSGPADILPKNRFAIKKIGKGWIVGGLIIILLGIYITTNFNRLLGVPHITIDYPAEETSITTENPIVLVGRIDPRDALSIGGEDISVERGGLFSHPYALQPGLNTIEFVVTKLLGKEARMVRSVIYEPSGLESN